jgi:hypothetical protein
MAREERLGSSSSPSALREELLCREEEVKDDEEDDEDTMDRGFGLFRRARRAVCSLTQRALKSLRLESSGSVAETWE